MKNLFSIFNQFFLLGLISFGGPAAHLGYFQRTFVEKLNWLSAKEYAQLVALSQFLPGPASSQTGFAIGLKRGGLLGAIIAFVAFTLPSFLLMLALVLFSHQISESLFLSLASGLTLFAIVVIADAVLTMSKSFCQQMISKVILFITVLALITMPSLMMQLGLLVFAAIMGAAFLNKSPRQEAAQSNALKQINSVYLLAFALLLLVVSWLSNQSTELALFNQFFQAGSLVFGGGHVVLPMLAPTVIPVIGQETFMTGYAAAQAVPGPMFTMATYIGAQMTQAPFTGAFIATIAVFLPGFLLILAFYNSWQSLMAKPKLSAAIAGVNSAVVGLLLATLIGSVIPHAITSVQTQIMDILMVISGLLVLRVYKAPVLLLIAVFTAYSLLPALI
ncbi:chromate efflux transporter [Catenovulum sp. SM1970]|uniref:chromate efflux transporter n=1 Tax=Marinifaba aquimaris TaxID=2741323 RepID=UPI0015744546|nr:chromate efflux transporter [Marinifaba aquimaris]